MGLVTICSMQRGSELGRQAPISWFCLRYIIQPHKNTGLRRSGRKGVQLAESRCQTSVQVQLQQKLSPDFLAEGKTGMTGVVDAVDCSAARSRRGRSSLVEVGSRIRCFCSIGSNSDGSVRQTEAGQVEAQWAQSRQIWLV